MPTIEFDWDDEEDPSGNVAHTAEHEVTPDEAEDALRDPRRVPVPAYSTETEQRYGILGATQHGRILFVVFTRRRGRIRVITAREGNHRQKRQYRRRR